MATRTARRHRGHPLPGLCLVVCDHHGSVVYEQGVASLLGRLTVEHHRDLVAALEVVNGDIPELGEEGSALVHARGATEVPLHLTCRPLRLPTRAGGRWATGTLMVLTVDAPLTVQAPEEMLGLLAHDLRTPVTTIYAGASLLQRAGDRLPAATRESVINDVRAEADRLRQLVDDMIMTSEASLGVDATPEPVALPRLLEPILSGVEMPVHLDLPSELPPVIADPRHLGRALRDVVSFAVARTDEQSGLNIAARSGSRAVRLVVSTSGHAATEEGERYFEPWAHRLDEPRPTGGPPSLFVARLLVDAMGGRTWATPEPGKGVGFGFSLPRATETDLMA
ncbi:MAG: HAMP domain-containing histidine kinase [Chloroflexi bacterium]|nr:HAMP domain-containing histidine kinase [Chloroflexota bacterium]